MVGFLPSHPPPHVRIDREVYRLEQKFAIARLRHRRPFPSKVACLQFALWDCCENNPFVLDIVQRFLRHVANQEHFAYTLYANNYHIQIVCQ